MSLTSVRAFLRAKAPAIEMIGTEDGSAQCVWRRRRTMSNRLRLPDHLPWRRKLKR
jgi:hypothetical protein